MERIEYCPYCQEKHVVSETHDNDVVVGIFCNRTKRIINAFTTKWNGVDVYQPLREFARKNVDLYAVARLRPEKVSGLARKIAFQYMQTPEHIFMNYAFAAYHMEKVIATLRSEARVKGFGGSHR